MSEKAFLAKVRGRVTGVGFRYSTLNKAREMPELKGYVRNVKSNEVEVLAQGPEKDVERLLQWLEHGPPMAQVEKLTRSEIPVDPERTEFDIQ